MKKKFKKLLLICVMLILVPTVVYAATTKEELDKAKQQEEELNRRLKAVQSTLDTLKSDIADTKEYIAKLDEQMEIIVQNIVDLNEKIDIKNDEIAVTTLHLQNAQETEAQQYDAMKLRIKYMYENNNESVFDLVLNSSNVSEFLNKAEYVSKITEYDRQKLEEYIAIKESIEEDKRQLEIEEEELEDYKADMEGEQQAVQLILDEKQRDMEKLEADQKAYINKQKEIQKDIDALDALIAQLTAKYSEEQLKKANAVATQKALFAKELLLWPCPSSHRITSNFSLNRLDPVSKNYYSAHKGTDIAASTGTPIVAAAAGLVTAAGYSASMGNYIVISHGDGITTRYYHNSKLAVGVGTAVTAGQVISYAGSTGNSTGPHLHFEVRINNTPYDPMQFY